MDIYLVYQYAVQVNGGIVELVCYCDLNKKNDGIISDIGNALMLTLTRVQAIELIQLDGLCIINNA